MALFSRVFLLSTLLAAAACSPAGETSLEGDWTLDADQASLQFVTVKATDILEVHHFGELAGSVSADGAAEVTITLDTVSTNIDIRDERMREFLFETETYPAATISTTLAPETFASLATGEMLVTPVELTVDLHGTSDVIATQLAVTRLGPDKVLVATTDPIIVDGYAFGLDGGIEHLRELASLPSITASVPVTFSLVFER